MSEFKTEWLLELKDMMTGPMKAITEQLAMVDTNVEGMTKSVVKMGDTFGGITGKLMGFNMAMQGIGMIKDQFDSFIDPGLNFETRLTEMGNISGLTGKALTDMGERAKKMAETYGGTASDSVSAFTNIVNKLGIELVKSPDALTKMANSVSELGTLMNDKAGAADVLSSAINLFGYNLKSPIEQAALMTQMGNVMYESMRIGSAKVGQVGESLKEVGAEAKNAGVSFNETVAAIQALGKFAGQFGAEAGNSLKDIMVSISEGARGRGIAALAPEMEKAGVNFKKLTDLGTPLVDRLKELKKVQGDSIVMARVFGREHIAAGLKLLQNIPWVEDLTKKLKTATGMHEAATKALQTNAAKIAIMKAHLEDMALSVYNVIRPMVPFISLAMGAAVTLGSFALIANILGGVLKGTIKGIGAAAKAMWGFGKAAGKATLNVLKFSLGIIRQGALAVGTWIAGLITATAAQLGLNIAMDANPIGLIILGISAAIVAIGLLIKYWDNIKSAIISFTKWIIMHSPFAPLLAFAPEFKKVMGKVFGWVMKQVHMIAGFISKILNFGIKDTTTEIALKNDKGAEDALSMGMSDKQLKDLLAAGGSNNDKKKASKTLQDGMDGVSGGGGGGVRNVNVVIQKMIGIENLISHNLKESADKAGDLLKRALINEIRDSELAIANQ